LNFYFFIERGNGDTIPSKDNISTTNHSPKAYQQRQDIEFKLALGKGDQRELHD
jgi:hypothetical protein